MPSTAEEVPTETPHHWAVPYQAGLTLDTPSFTLQYFVSPLCCPHGPVAMPEGVLTPVPVFVIKTFKARADGSPTDAKVFINVCALDAVGRPVTQSGGEVTDRMLDDRGIDNLQVSHPLAARNTGPCSEEHGYSASPFNVQPEACKTWRCVAEHGQLPHLHNERITGDRHPHLTRWSTILEHLPHTRHAALSGPGDAV